MAIYYFSEDLEPIGLTDEEGNEFDLGSGHAAGKGTRADEGAKRRQRLHRPKNS